MAITSEDGIIAAAKQPVIISKASATAVALAWQSVLTAAGDPGAGVLAGTSTAAGVVPTDATAGAPNIVDWVTTGAIKGMIVKADWANSVSARMMLFDLLFKAGAYAFNANQALAAQPTFDSRVSYNGGSPNWNGVEIWVEVVTAMTGALAVTVTYTDQAGNTGHSTGAYNLPSGAAVGRLFQLPLQAGDTGCKQITNVLGATATVGTFNVLLIRRIAVARIAVAGAGLTWGWRELGAPEVFKDSCLMTMICPDATATGVADLSLVIASG